MTDLAKLIERVAAASGPDREIDKAVIKALGFHAWAGRMSYREPEGRTFDFASSDITASIDAALALTERVLPGIWWIIAKGRLTATEPLFGCELLFGADEQIAIADGPTSALAIVLATLRALQARQQ